MSVVLKKSNDFIFEQSSKIILKANFPYDENTPSLERLTRALDDFRETEKEYYQGRSECADEGKINRLYDFYQFATEHLASTLQKVLEDEK